jgi:prepilin-type processing-associated H-X9-DG protein
MATGVTLLVFGAAAAMVIAPLQSLMPGATVKQSQSLNNVKQLALGVLAYAQDYDDTFPGWVDNGTVPNGGTGFAHNTWDQQISGYLKSQDVFSNGQRGIKSPSDPLKQRVLTYGLNGALITVVNGAGQTPFSAGVPNPPRILGPGTVANPSDTILLAELATQYLIAGTPGGAVGIRPATGANGSVADADGSAAWKAALPEDGVGAVIDISPRDWVTVAGSIDGGAVGTYGWINEDSTGWPAASRAGVARSLHAGGGSYAFVDGHVKFMKIGETVG